MRIFNHLAARDVPITLAALLKPKTGYDGPPAAVAAALAYEQGNTRAVNALYAKSVECGDYQAKSLMDWFVNEQIEEEDTLRTLLSQLKIAGADGAGLLILDRELGARQGASSEAGDMEGDAAE